MCIPESWKYITTLTDCCLVHSYIVLVFCSLFIVFLLQCWEKNSLCGKVKIGTKLPLRIWKINCSSLFFGTMLFVFLCFRDSLSSCMQHIDTHSFGRMLLPFCITNLYWAPRGCFHHFPQANVLSSEAVISYELASGGDCLVVVIHHLFGRGDGMSSHLCDVQSEHLA